MPSELPRPHLIRDPYRISRNQESDASRVHKRQLSEHEAQEHHTWAAEAASKEGERGFRSRDKFQNVNIPVPGENVEPWVDA